MSIPSVTFGKASQQSDNPWARLPKSSPYVLEIDRASIDKYNKSLKNPLDRVILENIPEPFIGDPKTATVVLLNLNPGHSKGDHEAHLDPEFSSALRRNLRHERHPYPFYPLNPAFHWTPCARWWLKHIRELIERAGLELAVCFGLAQLINEQLHGFHRRQGVQQSAKSGLRQHA